MKKLLIAAALVFGLSVAAEAEEYSAKAMILYEPRTGTVLQEVNADARMLIASTTKIMTALVTLEHADLDETVCITAEQAGVEGSSMYLRAGEQYTVEELLFGLLLASGNDAAKALAEHVSGSEAAFADLMNEKCNALGLLNSHFVNPHGLDDPEQYSSARDLALLTAAAMENADFCRIFSEDSRVIHGICFVNHNKLLNTLSGCIGGKTGYTKAAGRTLVSAAERDGLRLICVTLSDPNDWDDHCRAYEEAFGAYRFLSFPEEAGVGVPVISGLYSQTTVFCKISGVLLKKDAETQVITALPRFVFAPVRAGEVLGELTVIADGEIVLKEPIFSGMEVLSDTKAIFTPWERLRRRLESVLCGSTSYGIRFI